MQSKIIKTFKRLIKFLIISLFILLTLVILARELVYPRLHFDIIKEEASKNNIDPYLILSVIRTESKFNSFATSNKRAKGLMQLVDSTANEVIKKANIVSNIDNLDLYDVNTNISIGCKYLAYLINHYNGNYYLAICAYNAGMGNVDRWIEQGILSNNLDYHINANIPFNETRNYLEKVINTYNIYRKLY